MERPRLHNKRSAENVCLNGIVNSVKCDHPCSEGYEVGNLVSNNVLERSKGFLVEGFIKPPVIVTFDFNCEIDLKYIYIQCNVGGQKSSGIELYICPSTTHEKQYESVSSGVLKGNEKGFVFHRYSENVRTKFGDDFCFHSFKSSRYLSVVKSAQLKIFKTNGSSVPALGKVEFWGVPRKPLPNIVNNHTKNQNLIPAHPPSKLTEVKYNLLKPACGKRSISPLCGFSQNVKVPEDFIDPITCEIMCQPMILPSGKVIDISTLESHEKAESKWGRGPSDPFTGILFTSSSKPVVSSDLKARIDKFLCDNGNNPEFHKIPRTVGRTYLSAQKNVAKPSVSKLICNKAQIFHNSLTKRTMNNGLSTSSGPSENHVKQRKIEDSNKDCNIHLDLSKRDISSKPTSSFVSTSLHNSHTKKATNLSFQERMEKSLELSLKSTLSNLPSFTADDHKCNDNKIQVECNVCKVCDNLFSISCNHYICRNCLVCLKRKGSLSCSLCGSSFESHEVQKVHLKS